MTPTADLMKLEQELRALAHKLHMLQRPQASARVLEVAAALTASCDARVGGEVTDAMVEAALDAREPHSRTLVRDHYFSRGRIPPREWDEGRIVIRAILEAALATPAQPKASEGKAGGEDARKPDGYAYRYRDAWGSGRTVIKFNDGRNLNDSPPVEAVPYYLGTPPVQVPEVGLEIREWMVCGSRAPWAANSLRRSAEDMRKAEKRCRNAFKKDWMGEPARFVAGAYGEAAEAFERRLAAMTATLTAPGADDGQ